MAFPYELDRTTWTNTFKEKGVIRGELLERRDKAKLLRETLIAYERPAGWKILVSSTSVTFMSPDMKTHVKAMVEGAVHVERKVSKFEWKSVKEKYSRVDDVIARVREIISQH